MTPALLLALPLAALAQEASIGRSSTLLLEGGARIREVLTHDVDQDGRADLVVAARRPGATDEAPLERRLPVHLRRARGPAFVAAPDASLALTADVVAFAVADVTADPGREIVLLNATGAFAWRPKAAEDARIEKLVACELLWQIPDPERMFHWQAAVVDLDRDGLDDLVLPGPGLQRVALQRRGESPQRFPLVYDLLLPASGPGGDADGLVDAERAEIRRPGGSQAVALSFESGSIGFEAKRRERGPFVAHSESVPAATCVDWDADGDLDVLALSGPTLRVFRQQPTGTFAREHELALASPVAIDRGRALDVSFSARALDLDLDARADCLFFAGDKRAQDVRTQVLVYLHEKAGGARADAAPELFARGGAPSQLFVIGGFARPLRPQDVDGDGRPDLVAGSVQPDLIDELRAVSTERIDAELYVYRNGGRGFSKRPDLVRKLSIPARNYTFAADFVGDVTGDGISELLVREESDRLRLYPTRRSREGWTVPDEPLWEIAVDPEARLLLPGRLSAATPDLWVVEKDQILCVTFL